MIKKCFVKAVGSIFKTFSEFIVTGDVVQPASGYDAASGDKTGTETVYPISEIIFVDYKQSRIDGQIIRDLDKEAIFRVSELAVTPTAEMILRLSGGDEWDIIRVKKDPSETIYQIQCRRP